mmetsp:Transcript_35225/g.113473  ORF Transcript_35225/g.113473 Transcript_35225/m.113473 type:complete len:203 (-) Transcript_35225:179-787(-)
MVCGRRRCRWCGRPAARERGWCTCWHRWPSRASTRGSASSCAPATRGPRSGRSGWWLSCASRRRGTRRTRPSHTPSQRFALFWPPSRPVRPPAPATLWPLWWRSLRPICAWPPSGCCAPWRLWTGARPTWRGARLCSTFSPTPAASSSPPTSYGRSTGSPRCWPTRRTWSGCSAQGRAWSGACATSRRRVRLLTCPGASRAS